MPKRPDGFRVTIRLDEALTPTSGVHFVAGKLLARVQSAYQLIEVYETADLGRLMRIDGVNMTSDRDEFLYHEALVHPAAAAHPDPRQVLVIGGGDGGSSEEVLKHSSVANCLLCELDGTVIDVAREWLPDIHRNVWDSPRLEVAIADGMAYVRETASCVDRRVDLIYLDLTDPVGPAEALYQPAFFADCKRALAAGGALVLHLGAAFSHPARVAATVKHLREVFNIVSPYFVHIPTYGASWGFAVASDVIDLSAVDAGTLDRRLTARGVSGLQLYTGEMHHAMQALPPYVKALI